MPCFRCGFSTLGAGRSTREIHDEITVDVDGQLGAVMQPDVEVSIEHCCESLSAAISNL